MKIKPATAEATAAARDRKPVVTVIGSSLDAIGQRRSVCAGCVGLVVPGAFTLRPSIAPFQRWERREGDDLATAQRLDEWLEAAMHQARELAAVDLHPADPRGACDLPRRRGADEGHVDSLRGPRLRHAQQAEQRPGR